MGSNLGENGVTTDRICRQKWSMSPLNDRCSLSLKVVQTSFSNLTRKDQMAQKNRHLFLFSNPRGMDQCRHPYHEVLPYTTQISLKIHQKAKTKKRFF